MFLRQDLHLAGLFWLWLYSWGRSRCWVVPGRSVLYRQLLFPRKYTLETFQSMKISLKGNCDIAGTGMFFGSIVAGVNWFLKDNGVTFKENRLPFFFLPCRNVHPHLHDVQYWLLQEKACSAIGKSLTWNFFWKLCKLQEHKTRVWLEQSQ